MPAPREGPSFGVVSYNAMMSVPAPLRFNGIRQRRKRLGPALYSCLRPGAFDVVCFQELVFGTEHVLRSMVHHPHHTSVVRSSLFGPKIRLWPSGLFTASRFPIVREGSYVFTGRTYHVESVVAKGALYTCIAHPDIGPIHVVNTHLNAWTTSEAQEARRGQVVQIRKWLGGLGLPPEEPLVVRGDWNPAFYECREEMLAYSSLLGAELVLPAVVQFSCDGQTNTMVGLDDPAEYSTWKERNGCYEDVLSSEVGMCTCCPRQLLDGFVVRPNHITRTSTQVVRCKTRRPFRIQFDLSTTRFTRDVSDHYPVLLTVQVDPTWVSPPLPQAVVVTHDGQWEVLTLLCVTTIAVVLYLLFSWVLFRRGRT